MCILSFTEKRSSVISNVDATQECCKKNIANVSATLDSARDLEVFEPFIRTSRQ